jgi:hypothetical protein
MHLHLSLQIGIQFVQVGNDPDAKEYLEWLDNGWKKSNVRDIVDTTPYNGRLDENPEVLVKILLGGILRRIDNGEKLKRN